MPQAVLLHDKTLIEGFARSNPFLHLFELADLDDHFWPHTVWYGWASAGHLTQLALLYTALARPVLLAYPHPPVTQMCEFLHALLPLLPRRFYAHLDPACLNVLSETYSITAHGIHWKMGLIDQSPLASQPDTRIIRLAPTDLDRLKRFYAEASPDMILNRYMIETGYYYGVEDESRLISVAGLHAYSPTYRVAVLGNVATHPDYRRQGLGRALCGTLCRHLVAAGMDQIGLHVKADNVAAIQLYHQLGFEKVAEFGAYNLQWEG